MRDITGGAGVDHVVDVDFGGNLAATLASLRMGGSLAFYASNGDREPRVSAATLMQKNLTIHGMVLPSVPHEAPRAVRHCAVHCHARADVVGRSETASGRNRVGT